VAHNNVNAYFSYFFDSWLCVFDKVVITNYDILNPSICYFYKDFLLFSIIFFYVDYLLRIKLESPEIIFYAKSFLAI